MTQQFSLESFIDGLAPHLHERARGINAGISKPDGKAVVYWTHHALRADENPALDVARTLACQLDLPLLVYQGISENYRYASDRHHTFMLEGARDLQQQYAELDISYAFHLQRSTYRRSTLSSIVDLAAVLVTDEFSLEPTRQYLDRITDTCQTPTIVVDASCVVPTQLVGKPYTRAFQFRNDTEKLYADRVTRDWPACQHTPKNYTGPLGFEPLDLSDVNIDELVALCRIDHTVPPVSDTRGGSRAGYSRWSRFKSKGLKRYARDRNDPTSNGSSRMSAYLHYGMVSPMRLARESKALRADKYLDELLIWRELAYAYCYYNEDVDLFSALPQWAQQTLRERTDDHRNKIHSIEEFSRAKTEDRLWDAAQRSLLKHGELHNNVRMTWGKGILQWTWTPEEALRRLIDLNHRFALDGRDPSSYGGILWCLGQFDRPFSPPQPIFGSVRPRSTKDHLRRLSIEHYEEIVDRPIASDLPKVAIIGAGLGGLIAGRTLQDHGIPVHVFEKSRGHGGRSSTRRLEEGLQFDHGAQFFTIRDGRCSRLLESWLHEGCVLPWTGRLVNLADRQTEDLKIAQHRFVGVPSMSKIGRELADDLTITTQCRIKSIERSGDQYFLGDGQQAHGPYDLVICNMPPTQVAEVAPDYCTWKSKLSEAEMAPCWSVMVAFTERWNIDFDGAYVANDAISWISRDSSKPKRPELLDCWVIKASWDWSQKNLERQTHEVASELFETLKTLTNVPPPERLFMHAHRWRYAEPSRFLTEGCLWDEENRLGACGDWCEGPHAESAIISGMSMAGRIFGWLHRTSAPKIDELAPEQLSLFQNK